MNILITGGAGYLGSRLVPYLQSFGHTVRILDNLRPCPYHPPNRELPEGAILGSVCDRLIVREVLQDMDAVIHLAAVVSEEEYRQYEEEAYRTNVFGTAVIVDCARDMDIPRLILASTGSVYGLRAEECNEESPVFPLGPYTQTKLQAEKLVLEAGYTVVRFGTLVGASPRLRRDLLPHALLQAVLCNQEFTLYDPQALRPYTDILDAMSVLRFLLHNNVPQDISGHIFNDVSANLSKRELADLALSTMPRHFRRSFVIERSGDKDQRNYAMGNAKLYAFGWRPHGSITRAMNEAYLIMKDMDLQSHPRSGKEWSELASLPIVYTSEDQARLLI